MSLPYRFLFGAFFAVLPASVGLGQETAQAPQTASVSQEVLAPVTVARRLSSANTINCKLGDYATADFFALPPDEQDLFLTEFRAKYAATLRATRDALRALLPRPVYMVSFRLKTSVSIKEKITRKGYSCFSQFSDIVGTRVIAPAYASFGAIQRTITDTFDVAKAENLLDDKPGGGYRALHYDVIVLGRKAEIQVMTRRMAAFTESSHPLAYKGPYAEPNDPSKDTPEAKAVRGYLKKLGDAIHELDRGNSATLPPIPATLPDDAQERLNKTMVKLVSLSSIDPITPLTFAEIFVNPALALLEFYALDEFLPIALIEQEQ
ncbi:MAG: hypothetical protein GKS06_11395 [Acidobacteria bacterium]|nr:hypothetical protein [Acidobacteriota bacterium]